MELVPVCYGMEIEIGHENFQSKGEFNLWKKDLAREIQRVSMQPNRNASTRSKRYKSHPMKQGAG